MAAWESELGRPSCSSGPTAVRWPSHPMPPAADDDVPAAGKRPNSSRSQKRWQSHRMMMMIARFVRCPPPSSPNASPPTQRPVRVKQSRRRLFNLLPNKQINARWSRDSLLTKCSDEIPRPVSLPHKGVAKLDRPRPHKYVPRTTTSRTGTYDLQVVA